MRVAIVTLVALPLLSACGPDGRDRIARDASESVVGRAVATRFPGLPVEPAVDCIVANATRGEMLGLASDTMTGPTAATTETILAIARRPETARCLIERGPAAFPT